jgi:hypothetical protein
MLRLPKALPQDLAKVHLSPKANRIIRKPTSVKRPSHRHNLSDAPRLVVPFHSKPLKPSLKLRNRDSGRAPIVSIYSPKVRVAATSRPKTFAVIEAVETASLINADGPATTKYSDSGISTEQILQSYTSRVSGQMEEMSEMWKAMKLPCTAATVIKLFGMQLSNYEQSEILSYGEIYYIGIRAKKVKNNLNSVNFGYDDERGDYKVVVGDQIAYRFEILKILGQGSFGQVLRVYDHKENQKLALKIIRNKSRFHKQAMVEIDVLRYLKEKDPKGTHCVVHLNDNFIFRKHVVFPT